MRVVTCGKCLERVDKEFLVTVNDISDSFDNPYKYLNWPLTAPVLINGIKGVALVDVRAETSGHAIRKIRKGDRVELGYKDSRYGHIIVSDIGGKYSALVCSIQALVNWFKVDEGIISELMVKERHRMVIAREKFNKDVVKQATERFKAMGCVVTIDDGSVVAVLDPENFKKFWTGETWNKQRYLGKNRGRRGLGSGLLLR